MSGTPLRGLLGTDVLRAVRRGEDDPADFVDDRARFGKHPVSQVSVLTLLADALDEWERNGLRQFLMWCHVYTTSALIVCRAQRLLERLPPPAGLTADDAVVAATALAHKLPLYTLDPGKFAAVPGLTAIRPY